MESRSRLTLIAEILKNRNLAIMVVTWILFSSTRPLFYQFESDYVNKLGASPEVIGLMNSVVIIVSMLAQIPGGYMADKKGRKGLVAWGTLLLTLPSFAMALARSWKVYFVASIITALLGSLYIPALQALFQDSLPKDARGFSSSLIDGISWVIPSILGSFLGGYLYEVCGVSGLRIALVVISASYLVSGILRFGLVETLVEEGKGSFEYSVVESLKSLKSVFSWAFSSIGHLLIIQGLFGVMRGTTGAFWVLYALRVIGVSKMEWGSLHAIYNLVYFPLSLYGGRLSDKRGRVRQMRYVPLLWALSNLIFVKATGFSMVLLAYLISLFGEAFWWPALGALWIDVVPRNMRARVSSVRNIVSGISSSIASAIGGFLYARNAAYPFIFVIFVNLLFIPMVFAVREPEVKEE